jgi:hypothetical protein
MSPEEMRQKAIDLFNKRFHCSQAVLAVGLEKLNIANETLIKSMGAFGGISDRSPTTQEDGMLHHSVRKKPALAL